jgi:large subunit ribosomal protein L15
MSTGKRIVELQASLGVLAHAYPSKKIPANRDPFGRKPFEHPSTDGVEVLTKGAREWLLFHRQMAKVAVKYGIPDVMRWTPKNVSLQHLALRLLVLCVWDGS